jgi:hypothetical protein
VAQFEIDLKGATSEITKNSQLHSISRDAGSPALILDGATVHRLGKSILPQLLGGAALQRCGKGFALSPALAAEVIAEKLRLVPVLGGAALQRCG